MPVLTNLQQFSEILRKTAEKSAKMFSLVMRIYLLTVDKGCEGLGDTLPLRHGAKVEGQVNPLVRDQHRLEGRLRRGHSLCIQISVLPTLFKIIRPNRPKIRPLRKKFKINIFLSFYKKKSIVFNHFCLKIYGKSNFPCAFLRENKGKMTKNLAPF
jgi:hypothetical protein